MSVEAVVKVEVRGVEPFKSLVEAAVAYRTVFRGPASSPTAGGTSELASARNALFAAIDAVNADEALWHEEHG